MKKKLLGVGITVATERKVLEYITKNLGQKYYIVTPNPEILAMANRDSEYKKVLNKAKLALPDGVGVIWASKILGVGLKEKITGIDLVQNLCKAVAKQPITVSFLGGGPKIAERAAECLKKRFPGLRIEFSGSEIANFGLLKGTDILFVAYGSPKQEFWIEKNLKKLPVKVAIGVGGAFDMISGEVERAPFFLRELGLEWLYRLIRQPWRAKRQISLLKFIFLVLKERLA